MALLIAAASFGLAAAETDREHPAAAGHVYSPRQSPVFVVLMLFDLGFWYSGLGRFGMIPRDCLGVFNGTFSVVWVVEPDLTLVCML